MAEIELGVRSGSDGQAAVIDASILLDHTLVIAADGMGKTSIARVLVDQVLALGCPVVMIDTVGDMTSRLESELGLSILHGYREQEVGGSAIRLRRIDLDVAEAMFMHPTNRGINLEDMWDVLDDHVAALMGMLGFSPKKYSPEFSLVETLVSQQWSAGSDVSLELLTMLVQVPPIAHLGAFALDYVISADRRQDLAGAIDGLCRSLPVISDGLPPRPLVIDELLHIDGSDRATATVLSFAFGSRRLQNFTVATLLADLKAHAVLGSSESHLGHAHRARRGVEPSSSGAEGDNDGSPQTGPGQLGISWRRHCAHGR